LTLITITVAVVVIAVVLRDVNEGISDEPATTIVTGLTGPTTSVPETTTTGLPAGITVCDLYTDIALAGVVASPDLVEASGLAASRVAKGVLWSHNDSRGTATVYAFTTTGEDLGAYDVPDAFALDWEDMSPGPGPKGEGFYLYVGDIGDNFDIRGGLVTVYRVPDADPRSLDGAFSESTPLTYRYPEGSYNAEALFIDPVEPALYLVTKGREEAVVFRGSLIPSDGPVDLDIVSTLFLGAEVSGADMSADGTTLVLRGYRTVWMWHRDTSVSVSDMLRGDPCEAASPDERQGEAIAFDLDLDYWTVSEGSNSPIQVGTRAGAGN
jgi:hypothetical protein